MAVMTGTDRRRGSLTPDETFALVGHETRIAILRAMLDDARVADVGTRAAGSTGGSGRTGG